LSHKKKLNLQSNHLKESPIWYSPVGSWQWAMGSIIYCNQKINYERSSIWIGSWKIYYKL